MMPDYLKPYWFTEFPTLQVLHWFNRKFVWANWASLFLSSVKFDYQAYNSD